MNFATIPPVTKRLIILNVLVFAFTGFIAPHLSKIFALYYFESPGFRPYQIATHMFTHGGIGHLFFNMFGIWMFGSALERVWGAKRYLTMYFVAGLGALLLHQFVVYLQVQPLIAESGPELLEIVRTKGYELILNNQNYVDEPLSSLNGLYNGRVVGASGALFGILVGFAMLFPNTELMLIFFPMPIKAKYFVPIYAGLELLMGLGNFAGDNIAHFAHLGGALFGFILVKIWAKDRSNFY